MARWLIDFDSTTADLQGHMCDSVRAKYNALVDPEDITTWEWWAGHEHEEFVWGDECFLNRAWTLDIPPKRGVRTALNQLRNRGDEYVFVSDRYDYMQEWLEAWLRQRDIAGQVVVTNKERTKVDIARELDLTLAVEDSPHWCMFFEDADQIDFVYVMDQPYNREIPNNHKMRRIRSWVDFMTDEGLHT